MWRGPFVDVTALHAEPTITPGMTTSNPLDHYALLRTTDELLGEPLLGHAASAPSMRPLLGL